MVPRPFPLGRSTSSFNPSWTPSSEIHVSAYIAMDRKLLTQIEEIKVKVNLNTKLLHALMRKIDNIGSSCTEDNTELLDQTFPLATRQDIHNLESRLDEELKGNLIKILSGIGGETLKATQINWKGKGDKIAFSTLKLKDLLTTPDKVYDLPSGEPIIIHHGDAHERTVFNPYKAFQHWTHLPDFREGLVHMR
uniref:Uncharacterized protein n=1 Tax=Magallana gigas TaxID=29159 RepID=K1QM91_MAGGI